MRGIIGLFLVLSGAGCDEPNIGGLCEPPPFECPDEHYFTQWDCNPDNVDLDGDGRRLDRDIRVAKREAPEVGCMLQWEYCNPGGREAVERFVARPGSDPRPNASRGWSRDDLTGEFARLGGWTELQDDGDELRHNCCRGSAYLGGITLRGRNGSRFETLAEYSCPPFGAGVPAITIGFGELPPAAPMIGQ